MPRVGMRHVVAAQIDEEKETSGQPLQYKKGMIATRAVAANITYERSENKFYANDVLAENDNSAASGTISIEGSEFLPEARVYLFNVRKKTENGKTVYRETSVPSPYIGLGYLTVTIYNGQYKYTAYWIHKMQFALNGDNAKTKGETIEWQTETAEGTIMGVVIDETGEPAFRDFAEFATAKEAEEWLDAKAGIAADAE